MISQKLTGARVGLGLADADGGDDDGPGDGARLAAMPMARAF